MSLRHPRRAFAGALCAGLLAAGCSDPSQAVPPPAPASPAAPSPSPSPTPPPPAPVDGQVQLAAVHLEATGTLVYSPGSAADEPPAVDEPAVHAFVGAVDRWLDAHLTALQSGVVPELPPALVAGAPAAVPAVTTALTDPTRTVAAARYDVEVGVDGGPRWASVRVLLERVDGSTAAADFVFASGPGGPELVAAGPPGEVSP